MGQSWPRTVGWAPLGEQDVDELDLVVSDCAGEGGLAFGAAVVGTNALFEQPYQRLFVVVGDSFLDDALRAVLKR